MNLPRDYGFPARTEQEQQDNLRGIAHWARSKGYSPSARTERECQDARRMGAFTVERILAEWRESHST